MKRKFINILFYLFNTTFFIISFININCFSKFQDYKFNQILKNSENILQISWNPYWTTYFGGNFDDILNFSLLDSQNNLIAVGITNSNNLPTQPSSYQNMLKGKTDIYIVKFSMASQNIIWSSYFGGSDIEYVFKIGLDKYDRIWIIGETHSADFPIQGTNFTNNSFGANAYIICFDNNGKLLLSTVLGGSGYDALLDLSIKNDYAYFVGRTFSSDFPTTPNAYQKLHIGSGYNGIVIRVEINSFEFYSTYFALENNCDTFLEGIAIDNNENIILGGFTNCSYYIPIKSKLNRTFKGIFDVWLVKLDKSFNIIWSALFGGSSIDRLSSLQCDSSNNIYFLSFSNSSDLEFSNGFQNRLSGEIDAIICKISPDGDLIWGTWLGGSGIEGKETNPNDFDRFMGSLFLADNLKSLGVNFSTTSKDIYMVTTTPPFQPTFNGGKWDSYSLILDSDGYPYLSTYIGGNSTDFSHSIFFTNSFLLISGQTFSSNFPVTQNAIQKKLNGTSDGFIALFFISPDTIPPQFFSFSDSCGSVKTYFVKDSQQVNSGIASIKPIVLDNVNFFLVQKSDFSAKFVLNLLDKKRRGYFKIEVTDKSNNKLIIEDTLFEGISHLLQFSPSNILDFGMVNFNKTTAKTIWLVNKTTDTIVLNKLSLRKNIDFSIPPSQLPIIIPPLDSFPLTIFFAPLKQKPDTYFDTLDLNEECFFEKLILTGVIDTNKYSADSKCSVQVFGKSNFSAQFRTIKIHKLSKNEILIVNEEEKEDFEVQIYDYLGNLVYEGRSFENQLNFELPTSSVYLLLIKTSNYSQKILFLLFDF